MPSDASKPLQRLSELGQSVWIDFLSRQSNRGGHLQELIDEDSVVGATSNPSIFQKAMAEGAAYDDQLAELGKEGLSAEECFWALAEQDIREACDLFAPAFEASAHRDGYVSIEVDPRLAYDTLTTFREAMRLHEAIDKPNLMVKIPATKPGLGAIEDAIAKGRSINITLIFSLERYAEVAESYVRGLERLVAEGGDPTKVASVASFFVSRIDTEADRRLRGGGRAEGAAGKARDRQREARLRALQGGVRGAALGVPAQQGRHVAARAVGLDLDEEPRLLRRALRRRAARARNGQHDARGDDPRLPGPRRSGAAARARRRGRAPRAQGNRRGRRRATKT